MKFIGYESYTSWIITIGSCIINCTSQTPYRIAGLMYVSIVDYYETDRETASIPILIFIIVRCLGGPFCGILGEKFSAENITVYGSIIAAIGFGGCFFAENIIGLSIFLGIIFGIGMTGSNTFLPTIVKKYFNKNINSANGIAQAGSCLGAILIPPVAVYLLDEYGLPGTFLIISALMLHALPISMIMQKAGLVQDKIIEATKRANKLVHHEKLHANNEISHDTETSNILEHISKSNEKFRATSADKMSDQLYINNGKSSLESATEVSEQIFINNQKHLPDSTTEISEQMHINKEKSSSDSVTDISEHICVSSQKSPDSVTEISEKISINNQKYFLDSSTKMSEQLKNQNSSSNIVSNIPKPSKIEEFEKNNTQLQDSISKDISSIDDNKTKLCESREKYDDFTSEHSLLTNETKLSDIEKKQMFITSIVAPLENSTETPPISNNLHNSNPRKKSKFFFLKVFSNLPFLIIMLATGLHNYVSVLVWTTMIDYSRDKGIAKSYEVYFLMMHPFCEIIGRVCFGWVTDLGYLTVTKYSMICFSLMGLTCSCVLLSADFWIMMLGALTFAISCGATTAVFPGMVFTHVPEELQSMAIASRYALSGPLIFTSAPLIGFFRESNGSYDGYYGLFIAICILCAAIMPLMDKLSARDLKAATRV